MQNSEKYHFEQLILSLLQTEQSLTAQNLYESLGVSARDFRNLIQGLCDIGEIHWDREKNIISLL